MMTEICLNGIGVLLRIFISNKVYAMIAGAKNQMILFVFVVSVA